MVLYFKIKLLKTQIRYKMHTTKIVCTKLKIKMLEPLEQFNILMDMYVRSCTYSAHIFDNVSYTFSNGIMYLIFFLFVFKNISYSYIEENLFLHRFKNSNHFNFFCTLILVSKELKNILSSNMLLKKNIFLIYLIFLFLFIFFSNIFGMIFYNSTITSYFVLSFSLSTITFLSITLVGIFYNKFGFLKVLLPKGVPIYLS